MQKWINKLSNLQKSKCYSLNCITKIFYFIDILLCVYYLMCVITVIPQKIVFTFSLFDFGENYIIFVRFTRLSFTHSDTHRFVKVWAALYLLCAGCKMTFAQLVLPPTLLMHGFSSHTLQLFTKQTHSTDTPAWQHTRKTVWFSVNVCLAVSFTWLLC